MRYFLLLVAVLFTGCAANGTYVANEIGFPIYCKNGSSDCAIPDRKYQVDVVRDIVRFNCAVDVTADQ